MNKTKPRIGLTTYPFDEVQGYRTPCEYVDSVVRAGGIPLLLPPVGTDMVEAWLDNIDGLVLVGGGDIHPELHGNEMHDTIYNLSPVRDSTELALTRAALDRRMPTFAICRGLQLVNVACGGTLHVHLPEVVGEQVGHRSAERKPVPHGIRVAPDSLLARVMDAHEVSTSSWHHQAIDKLGQGLKAVAWAEDGVIEAVEYEGFSEFIAVQWHPEHTSSTDKTQQALFDFLINNCQQRLR